MDCDKTHVTRDMTLLLSTGRSECQQYRTVGIVLAYLNCHTHILFVAVFIFGGLVPGCNLLVCQ